eukprot:scaffold48025_cov51-Cyclotella_meneghiniana.AAC.1
MGSSPHISSTGRVLRSEASQFTIGREKDQSYYLRGSNARCSEHPDGTSTQPNQEQYLELRCHKRIVEHKLSTTTTTTPDSATGVLQYNEIRPGIETIDDSTSPIPLSQDADLFQYRGSNDKASKTDRPGIEIIDDSTSPIPPSQDVDFLHHQVSDEASKRDKHGVECIECTSSPIPPSQDTNLLQHQVSDATNKFTGLLPDEVFRSDNSQAVEISTDEVRVGMNCNSSLSNSDSDSLREADEVFRSDNSQAAEIITDRVRVRMNSNGYLSNSYSRREVRPPVFTAETRTFSSTRDFTNSAGDILIPHATLVPEHDSSIPNADIIEPERNALIVMGRKISHRILILGVVVFLAVVVSLAVALTLNKPEPAVYPTSSPSTSMYPSSTPSFQPSSSPTSIIYSDLLSIITKRAGYDEGSFSDKQSTRRIALDWLVQDLKSAQTVSRTTNSNYSQIEIFERFTMALIYYETRGDNWDNRYNFLSSDHICKWKGKFARNTNNLEGSIPYEMGFLNQLTVLDFGNNHVSSPLPPLNTLVNLTQIVMKHNDLDGLIPDLSALSKLNTLDLSENEFQGNLFDVSNLTQLETFKVSGNKVSGEVPLSFQDKNLTSLHLERTKLNGSLDFLCEHIPSMDFNLDCYDDIPEIQCNCCVGCTFVTRECNISNEVIGRIDITEAAQDFS